jgi:hypothetical protein
MINTGSIEYKIDNLGGILDVVNIEPKLLTDEAILWAYFVARQIESDEARGESIDKIIYIAKKRRFLNLILKSYNEYHIAKEAGLKDIESKSRAFSYFSRHRGDDEYKKPGLCFV